MQRQIELRVNGKLVRVGVSPGDLLIDVIRDQLRLTGTKQGCGTGECGACTVLLDDRPVSSCLVLAIRAGGRTVTTVEGLGAHGQLHPLQKAFVSHGSFQCGFCAPGILLAAKGLLDRTPIPTDEDIKKAISGNLCRCTGYARIVEAIRSASEEMTKNTCQKRSE